jgi:hypothetical protein
MSLSCLVGEILEALPASLYKHEATVALLEALDGEVMKCLRCLQAYHMAQVRDWLCQPSVPYVHSYMHGPKLGIVPCAACLGGAGQKRFALAHQAA